MTQSCGDDHPGTPDPGARGNPGLRLALDTNRYTDLCRGNKSVVEIVELADEVWIPFIVLGELRAGFAVGTQGPQNDAILRRFLLKSGVGVLYADEQTTHHYAAIYRQLRKQGTPIPTNDMWVAALVLQHSLSLCARDAHFDALPQLPRI
ncbi:MAG: type II toxin-antitoxin system VapC family toxin [Terriglobales bacterium]